MSGFLSKLLGFGPNPCITGEQVVDFARTLGVNFLPSGPANNVKKCENRESDCRNMATQMAISRRGGLGVRCCSDSICMMSAAILAHTRALIL